MLDIYLLYSWYRVILSDVAVMYLTYPIMCVSWFMIVQHCCCRTDQSFELTRVFCLFVCTLIRFTQYLVEPVRELNPLVVVKLSAAFWRFML